MAHITGKITTEKGKHRLHDLLNTMLVVTSSIGIASTYVADGKVDLKTKSYLVFEPVRYPVEVRLPFVGPLETALADKYPDMIEVDFMPKSQPRGDYKIKTSGLAKVTSMAISAIFGEFFEKYRDWLEVNLDKDPYKWPPIWNFGRIIRNSVAHGGAVYFTNPNARSVSWYGLTYGPADNGRFVLYGDMSVADFIALMFEMSNELDARAAPI